MNKLVLIPIIIGGVLVTAGAIALGVAFASAKTEEKVSTPYEFSENITNFDFDIATNDLEFKVSEGSEKKVIVEETDSEKYVVTLEDSTLKIVKNISAKKWYEFMFSWNSFDRKITVYLPAGTYGDLNHKGSTGDVVIPHDFAFNSVSMKQSTGDIDFSANVANEFNCTVSTGNIKIDNIKAKSMNLVASTGKISLNNVEVEALIKSEQDTGKLIIKNSKCENLNAKTSTGDQIYESVNVTEKMTLKASTGDLKLNKVNCKDYESKTSTGDVELKETIVANHIELETGTGDVDFYNSDAATLHIKTDTGHVKGNLLTDHIFYATSDTGTPNVPHSTSGGLCEIETDTGSIHITVGAK